MTPPVDVFQRDLQVGSLSVRTLSMESAVYAFRISLYFK
jgi:hypothetical protein